MTPPTESEQRGLAYAPVPFGIVSVVSSSYMIYQILLQQQQKRQRLYHRLVLAMNVALLPLSFCYIWGAWAVPEGTPYYVNASGTVNTCTAQGFITLMFTLTVPTYYVSLVLQAYLGIKHNFNEENYQWIETPVHVIAYCYPCAIATFVAVTENFNPTYAGCWVARSPQGCESDPDLSCERGQDISHVVYILGLSQVFLYLIFPPSVILAMYCWMKKIQKTIGKRSSSGMTLLRESARKQMMQSVYQQISVYLFSFWCTWVWSLIHVVYQIIAGKVSYGFGIFCACVFASQGFIYMVVYFALQRMGRPKVEIPSQTTLRSASPSQLTVRDIRSSAKTKAEISASGAAVEPENSRESFNFNIFDGTPDQDSPWAKFIDGEDESNCPDEEMASKDQHECGDRDGETCHNI